MQLPAIVDDPAFDALMSDADQVDRCLDYVATSLNVGPLTTPVRGSALVGMNDSSVLKLMPPFAHEFAASEQASLLALDGALPIATPRVLDSGTLDGWSYLHMTRLPGVELKERWPILRPEQRLSLATQLGECLHTLHRLPVPTAVPRCDWSAWTRERVADIKVSHQGAPPEWVEMLPELLASTDLDEGKQGWLHTEIMLEHLLVSGGDSSILSEVLRAAGEQISPERLFAMAILHRYGKLGWYKKRLGGPDDLVSWIQAVFGTNGDDSVSFPSPG